MNSLSAKAICRQPVRLELRRRQRIRLGHEGASYRFAVEHGCVAIDAVLPGNRRQVMLILYPGHVFTRDAAPPVADVGLTALLPSVLVRRNAAADASPSNPVQSGGTEDPASLMRLMARSGLHAFAIGRLTAEERISTLLIEMALFLGKPVNNGYVLELPLSRDDMADYLVLNPDTLSRLLTKLKASGAIHMPSRRHLIIKDFRVLASMTPLSDALVVLRSAEPAQRA